MEDLAEVNNSASAQTLREFRQDLICGSFSGVANWLIGHPLDSIKVRMQRAEGSRVTMLGIIRSTIQKEGFFGFYKGGTPPLFFIPFINSIAFSAYEFCKRQMGVKPGSDFTTRQAMIAGCFAGFVNSFVLSPIELVKCRLQLQVQSKSEAYYKGPIDCLKKIYLEEGITSGVFKGLVPTVSREIPAYAFQFAAYEITKNLLIKLRFEKPKEANPVPHLYEQFLAGGVGGFACWFFSYPQDIIKTKLQTQNQGGPNSVVLYDKYEVVKGVKLPDGGIINCAKEIQATHGLRGFWIGFSACAVRAIVANAFMFLAYEYAQSKMRQYDEE